MSCDHFRYVTGCVSSTGNLSSYYFSDCMLLINYLHPNAIYNKFKTMCAWLHARVYVHACVRAWGVCVKNTYMYAN